MSLPSSFLTQSLGEFQLDDDGKSYRPTNQNRYRFLFQPGSKDESEEWIALIDHRAPLLNSRWPAILASAPDQLKEALSAIGQSGLSEESGLRHITLSSDGPAILLVGLSPSEESHSLEVALDDQGHVQTITPTR